MADPRPEDSDMPRPKRLKTAKDLDPCANPYLAHRYEGKDDYSSQNGNGYSSSVGSGLSHFQRHKTTAVQAHAAEDGPNNPFNGNPLSQQYFNILKSRRDLPVHKQR